MTPSPLSHWIKHALDHTEILSRKGWADLLARSEAALSRWVSDDDLPKPRVLRTLVETVRDHDSDAARKIAAEWDLLAARPLHEVHPKPPPGVDTLTTLILQPIWSDHKLALDAVPPQEREQILRQGIATATRWLITSDHPPPVEAPARRASWPPRQPAATGAADHDHVLWIHHETYQPPSVQRVRETFVTHGGFNPAKLEEPAANAG